MCPTRSQKDRVGEFAGTETPLLSQTKKLPQNIHVFRDRVRLLKKNWHRFHKIKVIIKGVIKTWDWKSKKNHRCGSDKGPEWSQKNQIQTSDDA